MEANMCTQLFLLVIFLIFSTVICSALPNDASSRAFSAHDSAEQNPEEGEFFEGDMKLSTEQMVQMYSRTFRDDSQFLWIAEIDALPYVIDQDVSASSRSAILEGIAQWNSKTCINLVPDSSGATVPHLRFIMGTGCWSFVGKRQGRLDTRISIGNGCTRIGVVTHEIGHALGMYHEHSRSDRDNYVQVIYDNIQTGKEDNFNSFPTNNYGVPYDFYSMMHYSSKAFSIDEYPTLRSKFNLPEVDVQMGQRNKGFSYYDELIVNEAYGCLDRWLADCGLAGNPCVNGFVSKDCSCVCRPGTNGTFCEVEQQSYDIAVVAADNLLSARNVTTPQEITSLGYPQPTKGTFQNTLITAPESKRVLLTFTEFSLKDNCHVEYLEIRTNLTDLQGQLFCGNNISAATEFRSAGREMMLYEKYKSTTGVWKANVTFEDDNSTSVTSSGACNLTQTGEGEYMFTSPNYPAVHRDLLSCSLELSTNGPSTYRVELLEYNGRRKARFEYSELTSYSARFGRLLSDRNITLGLSTSAVSYASVSGKEEQVTFMMRITVQYDSGNRIVNLLSGENFTIDVSNYGANTFHEYWFRAPDGVQLMIDFEVFGIGQTALSDCEDSDYVRVDISGNNTYSNSVFGCTGGNILSQVVSTSNAMNVYVNGRGGGGTLRAVVSVVTPTK